MNTKTQASLTEMVRPAIKNLVAGLKPDKNRLRWTRAFERAEKEIESNDLIVWDGRLLQICSRLSGNLYRASANYCECRGYLEGVPCYHRAAARIMIESDRLTKESKKGIESDNY